MEFDETGEESIHFGPFELRPKSGELFRDGVPVKISPQPFKVLLFLVSKAGGLVTRKEIHEKIWGTETFVDFDKGLNLCIAQIREALGDDAQAPRFIETLPRRGYRFLGTVETGDSEVRPLPEDTPPVKISQDGARINRLKVLIGCLVVLLILATAAAFYFYVLRTPARPVWKDTSKSMLLVLPFENPTDDPVQDYFSDGLTGEMIARLNSLQPKRLGVIARTTSLTYKKTNKDIGQIGRELGVNYVLEGSVRREPGGRLRIKSALIKVKDQTRLWSEEFDREETQIVNIQREVAARVASALSLELSPSSSSSNTESDKSIKPSAFDAYLRGRYLIAKDTPQDLERSLSFFDQAIAEDPEFAPAYAAEVEALVLLAERTGTAAKSNLPKAKAAALNAVNLDPAYAEGYTALGSVQFWLEWNRNEAEENFKRALDLNPHNSLTRLHYGRFLLSKGQIETGTGQINEALRLDPFSLLTMELAAFAYLRTGNEDQAIRLSRRMLELDPKSPAARECLLWAYINKSDYSNAINIVREQETLRGAGASDLKRFSEGQSKELIEDRLRKDLKEMTAANDQGKEVRTAYAAWISIKLGEKEQTFAWLEKALNERDYFMLYLGVDSAWDSLRPDSRFATLRKKIPS